MDYRNLGNSGCAVSTLALGTMTFGTETDEAGSHAQLDRFVEAGGILVDTADVYSGGESEQIIGRWLAERPAASATGSCWRPRAAFPRAPAQRRGPVARHLGRALDASLRPAGVDTIDLYQVHAFDPHTPLEETLRFLDDVRPRRQDPLLRVVQLHRLAGEKAGRSGRMTGLTPPGDAAAAVQPAGPRDRVGDRARGA